MVAKEAREKARDEKEEEEEGEVNEEVEERRKRREKLGGEEARNKEIEFGLLRRTLCGLPSLQVPSSFPPASSLIFYFALLSCLHLAFVLSIFTFFFTHLQGRFV